MPYPNSGFPVVTDGTTTLATTTPKSYPILNQRGQVAFASAVTVTNNDATNSLKVSLNDGVAYVTLKPGASQKFDGLITRFLIAAAAGTASWTAVSVVQ